VRFFDRANFLLTVGLILGIFGLAIISPLAALGIAFLL
jgi:hypothetical protein